MLQSESFKKENFSQLVVGAFGDIEKLVRQELDLFLLNAKQTVLQVISAKVSYNWLSLCVTITTVFSSLALVEGLRNIQGFPLWAVYSLSALVFLIVGIGGFFLINFFAKKAVKKDEPDEKSHLATIHTFKGGNENA